MSRSTGIIVATRDGEGLLELELALNSLLRSVDPALQKRVCIVVDLDLEAARQLRDALHVARLSGQSMQ